MAISSEIVLCSDPTTRLGLGYVVSQARLTSPYITFFVSKNLFSKQLAPTDNTAKVRQRHAKGVHLWLKG